MILNLAYLEDCPNRDIMSQLYISEGTFNRTRRSGIRSVTRMLQEMEATLS
jgi:DNA-directed RNA polymerase specialized sigma24 family protein